MSTSHFFNGKICKLPNAYSAVKSVSPASFSSANYGKVLIINTDPAMAFGGSVNGELTKGGDALYKFRNTNEARAFFKSGYLWYLSELLFKPSILEGRNGVSELQYINALTSTAPKITFTLNGTLESGTPAFVLKVKDESVNGNGAKIDGSSDLGPDKNLKSGYAARIIRGVRDSSKYIVQIWQGSFKGNWTDWVPYDGVAPEDSRPELVLASPEISTIGEFVAWAKTSELFEAGFAVAEATEEYAFVDATSASDITSNAFVVATGGTASYARADLDKAMDLMARGDYSVIFSTLKADASGALAIHSALQYYVQSETKFPKYLAIPTSDSFVTACNEAKGFNSERVWCVYGKPRVASSLLPSGYRVLDSVAMTALVVGRICGLPPQVPVTFKELNISGIDNPLTSPQLEVALDAGLMTVHYDDDLTEYVVTRGINTLKNNTSIQNPDGSTFSIQISRICSQLNQDLVVNAKIQIFGSNETANVFTVSASYLENWVKTFLSSKIATEQQDNLILSVRDVSVERRADAYYVTYKFETNTEIAFMFFTGIAIN